MTELPGSRPAQWTSWQRFVKWRHRHTPYRDVPPFSWYHHRLEQFLPELREAGHHPVVRAQSRIADRLERNGWRRWRAVLLPLAVAACLPLALAVGRGGEAPQWATVARELSAVLTLLAVAYAAVLAATAVRDLVYCVDCGAEARASGVPRRLIGPMAGRACPGRAAGARSIGTSLAASAH